MEVVVERYTSSVVVAGKVQNLNIVRSIQSRIHYMHGIPAVLTQQGCSCQGQPLIKQYPLHTTK